MKSSGKRKWFDRNPVHRSLSICIIDPIFIPSLVRCLLVLLYILPQMIWLRRLDMNFCPSLAWQCLYSRITDRATLVPKGFLSYWLAFFFYYLQRIISNLNDKKKYIQQKVKKKRVKWSIFPIVFPTDVSYCIVRNVDSSVYTYSQQCTHVYTNLRNIRRLRTKTIYGVLFAWEICSECTQNFRWHALRNAKSNVRHTARPIITRVKLCIYVYKYVCTQ